MEQDDEYATLRILEERLSALARSAALNADTGYEGYLHAAMDAVTGFLHEEMRLPPGVEAVMDGDEKMQVLIPAGIELAPDVQARIGAVELLAGHHLRFMEELVFPALKRINMLEAGVHDFVHSTSHYLKAPLSVILGFTSLLGEEIGENAEAQVLHYIDRIHINVRLIEYMLNDLLYLARLKREDEEICDVAGVARECRTPHEGEGGALDVQDDMPPALINPGHLKTLLDNLIRNAVRFAGPDSKVTVGYTGGEYFVRDRGPGIGKQNLEKVLHMFYTTCKKEASCTGAGLSIVQKIIELYGGRIRIESGHGGTTVFFKIGKKS